MANEFLIIINLCTSVLLFSQISFCGLYLQGLKATIPTLAASKLNKKALENNGGRLDQVAFH